MTVTVSVTVPAPMPNASGALPVTGTSRATRASGRCRTSPCPDEVKHRHSEAAIRYEHSGYQAPINRRQYAPALSGPAVSLRRVGAVVRAAGIDRTQNPARRHRIKANDLRGARVFADAKQPVPQEDQCLGPTDSKVVHARQSYPGHQTVCFG